MRNLLFIAMKRTGVVRNARTPLTISLLILLLNSVPLYGFAPETPKNFIETALNLLSNRQYTFLAEYFENYYKNLAQKHPTLPIKYEADLKTLVTRNPFIHAREKILTVIIRHWEQAFPTRRSLFHCLLGELNVLREDYAAARKSYNQCKSTLHLFYLALIEKNIKNFDRSEELFLMALKKPLKRTIRDEIYLSLGHMAYETGHYNQAEVYLKKSRASVRGYIALYHTYLATQKSTQAQKIIAILKKKYPNNPEAKHLLENTPQK
ncbi:hypothetical protein COTS27_01193 [Spirochaetota bacterium]|nr:hypothetical protein COTS27_01193 [Spirochaetota bacterium]